MITFQSNRIGCAGEFGSNEGCSAARNRTSKEVFPFPCGGGGGMTYSYDVHVPVHLGISIELSAKLQKARETNTPTYSKIN